jgi:purine nucleosidase
MCRGAVNGSIPIILDTDIGSDIDDALALAYLLAQPRCELVGITTVSGDVGRRCAIADYVCRAVRRGDVPIHAGASRVLLTGPGQPEVPHYPAIEDRPHRKPSDWPANTALDFLRQTIRGRPGEITLLTIGPFTNIALLFAVDPEIPSLLKALVSMAGIFYRSTRKSYGNSREWNCRVDPIATAIVYGAGFTGHTSFGIDVTMKCTLTANEVRARFKGTLLQAIAPMAELWFAQQQRVAITFHDPLAAAGIFRTEICEYHYGRVWVPLSGNESKLGRTQFDRGAAGPHRVACSVNVQMFFDEFFARLR